MAWKVQFQYTWLSIGELQCYTCEGKSRTYWHGSFEYKFFFFWKLIWCIGFQFMVFLGGWGLSLSILSIEGTMWASWCATLWSKKKTFCERFMGCVTMMPFSKIMITKWMEIRIDLIHFMPINSWVGFESCITKC